MPLQRETVTRAALQVVDEVGLEGLTMRRLAEALDIQNPSLYWHFTNKQELLNSIAELMIAEAFTELQPPEPEQNWAEWLAAFARLFRGTMLRHRDGARILAEADISLSKFFEGLELAMDVLLRAGFNESSAAIGVITVIHYILGDVFEAQADPSSLHPGKDQEHPYVPKTPLDSERFPRITAFLHTHDALLASSAASTRFEEGLLLILDGLRANLTREQAKGKRSEQTQ